MRGANAVISRKRDQVLVIRKRLKSKKITRELHNEKMCLRLLNQLKHPNIIRLHGSYTYRGEHNFLFPCVDMDLNGFFRAEDRFGNFQWDFTFHSALRGLSSALSNTHSLHLRREAHGLDFEAIGYHHDIRPANILVSKETFILADFGLGNFKPANAQSQTPWKTTTGEYLAPECMDENLITQDVNRAIDVWAFGCLMAEVATYMRKGATGVKEFSDKRLLPGRVTRCCDSGFYRHDGNIKDEVKEWLGALSKDSSDESLISSLVKLSLQALTGEPRYRPKIATICKTLTFLSLKAHFAAIRKQFSNHLGPGPASKAHDRPTANKLWFLQERFRAWGRTLSLEKNDLVANLLTTLDELHDKSISTMATLFHELENWAWRLESSKAKDGSPMVSSSDARYIFESQVDQLVESLWDLLPANLQRRAEDYWHQAILSTDSKGVLDDVRGALRSRITVHDIADAMATMRKIRLEMLQPDSLEGAAEACSITLSDVKFSSKEGCHEFGRYQEKEPVLVERVRFTPASEKVNPVQMKLVIGLKAKSLGTDPKPKGLRTMHCMGAFEEFGDEAGYGFVYQYPEGAGSDPITLLQRLEHEEKNPKDHPLLGDKFQLAYALADFLKEFHTIGWLHENFNSHNVLFFKSSNSETSDGRVSNELQQSYVVGLQKSRPDGSFWQTLGPAIDDHLQDYQHPEYAGTGRYRLAFDYYSLGIVLLEIGLWRPLGSLLSNFRTSGLAQIRSELIKICQTRLGVKMGAVYRDAVLRCMDCSLERVLTESGAGIRGEESSDRTAALGRFIELVVEPLEKLAMVSI